MGRCYYDGPWRRLTGAFLSLGGAFSPLASGQEALKSSFSPLTSGALVARLAGPWRLLAARLVGLGGALARLFRVLERPRRGIFSLGEALVRLVGPGGLAAHLGSLGGVFGGPWWLVGSLVYLAALSGAGGVFGGSWRAFWQALPAFSPLARTGEWRF